ncbi:sugar-proton symporter [Blautia sp.]|uniref:sugar-proton symporter n=1 Tax=Blautia sp. TaxID=1955243 RepID=UPI002638F4FB|nr:sugar-proton symporter [Blautia sp.]MEE0811763.1 sugar-proton symporter [Blautia sp.]
MKNWLLYEENPMVKLCYQNNGRNTEEFYFDLQSQKVYKICLSAYYAKRNTKGIPWLFLSGGILATLLEQVLQRVLLPISVRMLLLFLVIGGLVLVNKKVKQSFIEKYQYVEEHTIGNSMEKEEILKLYTLGKWNRRALGFIVLIGLLAFLIGLFLIIKTTHLTGAFLAFLGGIIGIIFSNYGEFMEAAKVKKYLQTD